MQSMRIAATLCLASSACWVSGPALAEDPLGLYVGGSVGHGGVSTVANFPFSDAPAAFPEPHFAWQALAGVRPLSFLGAEFGYLDTGEAAAPIFNGADILHVRQRAVTAMGVAYLPLSRSFDLYGKLGVARLHTTIQSYQVAGPALISPVNPSERSTDVAYGAGGQPWFGHLAARLDFEAIPARGGTPHVFSIGLAWTF